jgi:hypothetical protein
MVAVPTGEQAAESAATQTRSAKVNELLTAHPELTDSQIAKIAGVSRALVWKARRAQPLEQPTAQANPDEAQDELERLIGANLPPSRLVKELGLLIGDSKTPKSVKLMAIRAAAEYGGVVTRKEKRDAEANATAPGPIFVFNTLSIPSAAPIQVVVEAEATEAKPVDTDKPTT